jgi:GTPase
MPDTTPFPEYLPEGTKDSARKLWEKLSPADRKALQDLIEAFPSKTNLIQLLLKLGTSQMKMAFGNKHRVAIVGPTNVGKSTLYNQLIQRKEDRADVSPLPGTTRTNQLADAGVFTIVDTPGADSASETGHVEQELALAAAAEADFLVIVFDAIQGIKRTEKELFESLLRLGKPYVVVLNKIDLVRRDKQVVLDNASEVLHLEPNQVIPIVARSGENIGDILVAITIMEPEMAAALGQALPQYRWQIAWRSIVSAASASAAIALTPLPVIDFIPLITVQTMMILSIARIYNYEITFERARELVVTLGLGFLGRMLFQELTKLGGIPGWVLSSAIAASTTTAIGYAASVWFDTGEQISKESLKRLTGNLTDQLLVQIRKLGKGRFSRRQMQDTVRQTLEELPASSERSNLDPS